MSATETLPHFLTVAEVAETLRVSPLTVRRHIAAGLPAYRVGGSLRVDADELSRWLEDRRPLAGDDHGAVHPRGAGALPRRGRTRRGTAIRSARGTKSGTRLTDLRHAEREKARACGLFLLPGLDSNQQPSG
ncbi:MAG: helix-turn-helix domain-containing protein [Actinobacteria bacterium]|nr:helix-turn-helix domain-containing protein [Actinomycetota bacterium]